MNGGIGVEKMYVLKYDTPNADEDDPNKTTAVARNSINFNFGLIYIAHLNYRTSFVIESRYHFLNINNTGGTNLTGNALVFSCGINHKIIKRGLNL